MKFGDFCIFLLVTLLELADLLLELVDLLLVAGSFLIINTSSCAHGWWLRRGRQRGDARARGAPCHASRDLLDAWRGRGWRGKHVLVLPLVVRVCHVLPGNIVT